MTPLALATLASHGIALASLAVTVAGIVFWAAMGAYELVTTYYDDVPAAEAPAAPTPDAKAAE